MSKNINSEEVVVSECSWCRMAIPSTSVTSSTRTVDYHTDSSSEELGHSDLIGLDYVPVLSGFYPEWLFLILACIQGNIEVIIVI